MRVGDGAQVEQVGHEVLELDLDLRLPELVGVFDALGLDADGVRLPVERRPGAAGDRARLARYLPVFRPMVEPVPRLHGIARQLDLDHSINHVASRQCRELAMSEHALDFRQRCERRERVVQDRKNTQHGERHADVGDDAFGRRHG